VTGAGTRRAGLRAPAALGMAGPAAVAR
jgi:hypothetical protein